MRRLPETTPLVSVVMSVHDDVARVERAVTGILQQSYRDLELIAIDDGSSDGSGALLDRLAAGDVRMRVVHQANAGLTRALIAGCRLARGRYIARQDSDDWSHPQRIADQVRLLDSDARIGFVSCATQYVGPRDEPLLVMRRPPDAVAATHALRHERQGPPAHGSVMFRAALYREVGGYREAFHYSQDSDLWLRLAERSWIAYVAETRYVALREVASTSGARRPLQRRFGEIALRCARARAEGRSEAELLHEAQRLSEGLAPAGAAAEPRAAADAAYHLGAQLQGNRDRRAARYLWQAVRARPWHWKAWLRLAAWALTDAWRPAPPATVGRDAGADRGAR